jgi:hypothetical protein
MLPLHLKKISKLYDGKTFLKQFFKPLSSLTTYHHFRAEKESPGIVFVKEYCDSLEKEFRLLKKRVVIDSAMPSILQQVHSISLHISGIQHPLSLNWT